MEQSGNVIFAPPGIETDDPPALVRVGRWHCGRVVPSAVLLSILAAILVVAVAGLGQPVFVEKTVYQRPPPLATEPKGRIAELIGMLSHESSEKRRSAARTLLKMGPAVEPQLQWARQHGENGGRPLCWDMLHVPEGNKWVDDPRYLRPWHAEHELDVLISHLQEQRRSQASTITLHFTDAPLTNVLRALGEKADADVAIGNWYFPLDWIHTAQATIDIEGVTYWEALQALQQSTGLTPTYLNGQNRLVLQKGFSHLPSNTVGSVVSGPIWIVADSLERLTNDPAGQEPGSLRLTLTGYAEPKFSGAGPHGRIRIDECVDDQGQSLILDGKQTFASIEGYSTFSWTLPVDLAPLETGREIKLLKGQFSIAIGPTDRYMTITNLMQAQGKSRELDGLKVVVKQVSATGSQYRIDVELSAPKESPYTRTFSASSGVEVWVWDEWPKTIVTQQAFHGVRDKAEHLVASWSLDTPENAPRPATLVWKTPTETRWHTVPFELRGIVVP